MFVFMLDKYLASLWQCQFFKRRPNGHGKVHGSHCDILRPTIIFSLYITSFNLLHKCSSISCASCKVQKVVLNPSSQSSFQTPRLNRGSRKYQRCRTWKCSPSALKIISSYLPKAPVAPRTWVLRSWGNESDNNLINVGGHCFQISVSQSQIAERHGIEMS